MIESLEIFRSGSSSSDQIHLRFKIKDNQTPPASVRLWAQSCQSGRWLDSKLFCVSPGDFRTNLKGFLLLHQQEREFAITYDSAVEALFSIYLSESRGLQEANLLQESGYWPVVESSELRQAGFLRHSSLSADQVRDISKLVSLRHGANFSVPGAGKTNALFAVHALERSKVPELKLLVVCPKNAFISWDDELILCMEGTERFVRLQGGKGQIRDLLDSGPNLSMMSYQQLRVSKSLVRDFLSKNTVHLVLDESHRIKGGRNSQQGLSAIEIAPFAFRRDILSGTPMPQGISDIVAQLEFLWPSQGLGRRIIEISNQEEQLALAKGILTPIQVRTTKRELGLKDPIIKYTPVLMSDSESKVYQLLRSEARTLLSGMDLTDRAQFSAIGKQVVRLLQFASHPSLILKSLRPAMRGGELEYQLSHLVEQPTTKFLKIRESVERIMSKKGEKVVIWTTFIGVIDMLEREFQEFGSTSIHGGISTGLDGDGERERRIRMFNDDPEVRVLVANPAACGEGISLHKAAHNAIYFDRSFNAAHFLQSVDRIHRRGLPEEVDTRVEVFVQLETIEEAVRDRLSIKVAALMELMNDPGLNNLVFDPEDVGDEGTESGFLDQTDVFAVRKHLIDD